MIERIHLQILCLIDEHGSLTAAANRLHLTQSALSHSMKKLEQQSAVALWQKEGRHLQLTQAGRYLLNEARRILPQLQRADATLAQYAEGGRGELRIGMECHPCYQWLLKVTEPYLMRWPGIDVDVKQRFQFGGMAALYNHDIDVLITPDPLLKPGVEFIPVFDYELVLVVAHDHALAGREWLQAEDLSEQTLYTYPVDSERLDIYSQFLSPSHRLPRVHKTLEATEIMLQLVARGRGVACLPGWLVKQYQQPLKLVAIRLGQEGIQKTIHLGVRNQTEAPPAVAYFLELAEEMAELSAAT
jgi:LysR family transcriptional regulator, regulator for metE and metH